MFFITIKVVIAYWWFFSDVEPSYVGLILAVFAGSLALLVVTIEAQFLSDNKGASLPVGSIVGIGIAYYIKHKFIKVVDKKERP